MFSAARVEKFCTTLIIRKSAHGTFLVVQWLRLCLPMQGVWVRSLVRQLGSHMPHSQKNQNIKQKTYCNKFNKGFKTGPHQKKKSKGRVLRNVLFWYGQTHNPRLIMKKYQIPSNRVASYNIPNQYSWKLSRSSKIRKVWETVIAKRRVTSTGWDPETEKWY